MKPRRGRPGFDLIVSLGLFVLLLSLLSSSLRAQETPASRDGALLGGRDQPLEVLAEQGIEWRRDQKLYIARGNAQAKSGTFTVHADTLIAYYRETAEGGSEIFRIDALGKVRILSGTQRIEGEHAIYLLDQKVAKITGGRLLYQTKEERVSARDSLEYWQDYQGRTLAVARGDAVAERPAEKQRFRGDTLTAVIVKDSTGQQSVRQVDGFGNVSVSTQKDYLRGDRGVFFITQQYAVVDGNVRVTQGANQLNGRRAEINFKTGVSRLISGGGERVRGLILPNAIEAPKGAQP